MPRVFPASGSSRRPLLLFLCIAAASTGLWAMRAMTVAQVSEPRPPTLTSAGFSLKEPLRGSQGAALRGAGPGIGQAEEEHPEILRLRAGASEPKPRSLEGKLPVRHCWILALKGLKSLWNLSRKPLPILSGQQRLTGQVRRFTSDCPQQDFTGPPVSSEGPGHWHTGAPSTKSFMWCSKACSGAPLSAGDPPTHNGTEGKDTQKVPARAEVPALTSHELLCCSYQHFSEQSLGSFGRVCHGHNRLWVSRLGCSLIGSSQGTT